jgi:CRP-like cAMP-binding protein
MVQVRVEIDMAKRRRSPVENETVETGMCSYDLRLQIIRGLPFLSSLDDKAIIWASSFFREYGYGPGQTIFLSHDPATHLYVVAFGHVELIYQSEEGRNVILDVLTREEFFGHLSGSNENTYSNSARALTSTCALVIGNKDFQRILNKYPAVTLALLNVVSSRLETAQETIRRLSTDPAEKRIASVLLRLAEKFGARIEVGLLIQLSLSREDIADMSGTITETASRVVTALRRAGIIRTGRKWISISDMERLSSIAGSRLLVDSYLIFPHLIDLGHVITLLF